MAPASSISLPGSTSQDKLERDLLGPYFTHLALAALDDEGASTRVGRRRQARQRWRAVLQEAHLASGHRRKATAHLGALASELLREVHAYFLPCEGVFHWKDHSDKGETIGVRQSILLLRDDHWTRFASDYGPIPDPREYPVPPELDAQEMVARRFSPYFQAFEPEEAPPKKRRS